MPDEEKMDELLARVANIQAQVGEVHTLLMQHKDLLAFASNLKQKATSPFGKIARVK
jgi:hypothetical protein